MWKATTLGSTGITKHRSIFRRNLIENQIGNPKTVGMPPGCAGGFFHFGLGPMS